MTENRRVFLNIVATYGRSIYSLVLGLLCGRWALMALGEVDYGLNGLVGGLAVFIAFFNNILAGANARFYAFSVGAAKVAEDKNWALEECRRWFNTACSVHFLIPFIVMVVGYPVGIFAIKNWLTIPADRISDCVWVFRWVCISCFIGMVNVPFRAMYTAKQHIAELTVYEFASATFNACFLYYMITHPGVWLVRYAAWGCCLSVVPHIIIGIRACCIFPECKLFIPYLWDTGRLRQLGAYSGWQMVGMFCGMARTSGMSIVINKMFGARMNAAQTIGDTMQAHCNTLAGAMQGAFTPVIVQACGACDYVKMRAFAMRTCKFNVILSALFAIPLALELPEVLRIWLKTPPAFAAGLCYCAMAYHFVGCCTVGHMIVVNATGRVRSYYLILGAINILTVPVAIAIGFLGHNVYAMMASVVFMEVLNSLGRVMFAKVLAGMRVLDWIREVVIPMVMVVMSTVVVGVLPAFIMEASFLRVCITVLISECVFLPMIWCLALTSDEKAFLVEKIGCKLRRMVG